MPMPNFLLEYQSFAAEALRIIEKKRAKGDPIKLQILATTSDSELLVKWLWVTSIVGGPVCFLIFPFVLSLLGSLIWSPLKAVLWLMADSSMVLIFAIFLLALYFTTRKQDV